jgi:hypothetical protein
LYGSYVQFSIREASILRYLRDKDAQHALRYNSVSSFYCAEIADMAVAKYREAMADDRAKYLDIVREEAGGRAKYLDIVGEEGTK